MSRFRHDVDLDVKIADPAHPITRFMSDFRIHDEGYADMEILPSVKPLLTTEHPDSDKLVGWTHRYRNAPIVYLQLGHDSKSYSNPAYQRLLAQSIRWAAGRLPDADEKGFRPLFNGRNLDGWVLRGKPGGFTIKDGVLRSESGKGGEWVRTEKQYTDFILKVEWRISKGGNSGVFIRCLPDGWPWEDGSEVQISSEPRDSAHCTGSLYGSLPAAPRPDETDGVWHEFRIECRGPFIQVFSDNVPVVDVDARTVPALHKRPLKGCIGLQDSHNPTGWVEFRNILIKELEPGSVGSSR